MGRHSAPDTGPGLEETGAGVVRIVGPYPPPPPAPRLDPQLRELLARPPQVTRYDRAPGPAAARGWAATSVVLAAAGLAAVVLAPGGSPVPARLDVPAAVAAPVVIDMPAFEAPAPVTAVPAAGTTVLPASRPVRVQIPALGVTSQVMDLDLDRHSAMEVPPGAHPVGWYDRSPTPGQLGPSVLAGHVDWKGERGAFYGLRELEPGDRVVVDRADGSVATFRVDRVEEHAKDDFPADEVYGDIDHAGLRLITCGGSFDEDSGNYRDNVIVFASLVATGP